MNLMLKAAAAALIATASSAISLAPAASAQDVSQWAADACTSEMAEYEVYVDEILEVITGKGGATLTMSGYNAASIPVVFVCTYTIDTGEVYIEYL